MKTHLRSATVILALSALGVAATSDLPDPDLSTASSAAGTITISPTVGFPSLAAAGLTVSVTLLDPQGMVIAGYPFQDIVLMDNAGGTELSFCANARWLADLNTNGSGTTTIGGLARGGGSTQGGLQVVVAGTPLNGAPLDIAVNSPDMNGDLYVNMVDVAHFAIAYNNETGYDFEIDLNGDGVENLLDISRMAAALKPSCP